jgi:hypothetical protein
MCEWIKNNEVLTAWELMIMNWNAINTNDLIVM